MLLFTILKLQKESQIFWRYFYIDKICCNLKTNQLLYYKKGGEALNILLEAKFFVVFLFKNF